MPFFYFDSTFLLLIPALLLAFWAQFKVMSTFKKYKEIRSASGITGAVAAKKILEYNGIYDVKVESTPGELSDHYDPRIKKVRLSQANYEGSSLAALAVAAHEVGHAIQHNIGYAPLALRHSILPVTRIASWAAFPLFLIGFFLQTPLLINLGIIFFAAVVFFHLVTLPVEFNASHRAIAQLEQHGMLVTEEINGAKKVLNAAALTYVAAATMALLQLIRLILISRD
ncbi:MAG: zinc metallopeptidase [Calditrichaceae bacterium]|nr:zinc metallopeptidase [Calditrichaceae bacterium]MBN2708267.1 zinc metallopeptidase [Calditrichaceae bacterium]RQV95194.1 MAG: zinc metallopeptidase [Calditrichota bacterium]